MSEIMQAILNREFIATQEQINKLFRQKFKEMENRLLSLEEKRLKDTSQQNSTDFKKKRKVEVIQ
ncbi:MAG: hypothetical protein ACXABI_05165 [Candidatus Hodarchaeales archaeon]|jgi:hypothetical protein